MSFLLDRLQYTEELDDDVLRSFFTLQTLNTVTQE